MRVKGGTIWLYDSHIVCVLTNESDGKKQWIKDIKKKIGHVLATILTTTLLLADCLNVSAQLPIKVARTITFKTTEGTNMDVDVSPDGNTLVFSMVGEIFTVSSGGGNAKQLTRGLALKSRPVWSPDGKMIAYTSDASGVPKIHVMDRLGTEILFKYLGDISSITDEICWKSRGDSVVKYNPRTLSGKLVDTLPVEVGEYFGKSHNTRLSLSERWLVYLKGFPKTSYRDSLMVVELSTKKVRLLSRLHIKSLSYLLQQRYCFSPDEKNIYIGYGGKIHKIGLENGVDEIIPFNADIKVDMAQLNRNQYAVTVDSFQVKYLRDIQMRPDGKQLVFAALNQIYVQDLPAGKPRLLSPQPFGQFQPKYSPDGKWVAYVSEETEGAGNVWRAAVSDGKPQRLTAIKSSYRLPAWSPDGNQIAFIKADKIINNDEGTSLSKIQIFRFEDKMVRDLTDSVPAQNFLKYSADGKSLEYTSFGKAVFVAYLAQKKIDGNFIEEHISNGEFASLRAEIGGLFNVQRCDGNGNIIYNKFENLYLVVADKGKLPDLINDCHSKSSLIIRFSRMGLDPHWEDEGRVIAWNYANRYYRVAVDKILAAATKVQSRPSQDFIDVTVSADNIIEINLRSEQEYNKGLIVLSNVRIITIGKANVIENGSVMVRDGRIVSVGNFIVPKDAKVLDLKGKTIMPGLIDLHNHIKFSPYLFRNQIWEHQVALAYGTTTSRFPTANYAAFGHEELLKTGQFIGPRLFHVGSAIRGFYGISSQNEADSVSKSRSVMGGISIKQYMLPTRMERQRLAIAAEKYKLNLTNEDASLVETIGMLKDGSFGVEHMKSPEEFRRDVLEVFARSGSVWTPAFMGGSNLSLDIMKGYFLSKFSIAESDTSMGASLLKTNFKSRLANWAKRYDREILKYPLFFEKFKTGAKILPAIMKAGGLVGVGSHGEVPGIGIHYEMWAMQMGGMGNAQVLECATLSGAKALGLERDLGSVEKGKIADLLILDGNPLEDIHNTNTIRYIMKSGILYDQKTLEKVIK